MVTCRSCCQFDDFRRTGSYTAYPDTNHSCRAPVSLSTLDHLATSVAIYLENSAGELEAASSPRETNIFSISGLCTIRTISLLSFAMMGGGVRLGKSTPYHWVNS